MTKPKLRIDGYYGLPVKSIRPVVFIPDGIHLKLLLHKENGFKLEHHIDVDEKHVTQFIHFEKRNHCCGTITGMRCEL